MTSQGADFPRCWRCGLDGRQSKDPRRAFLPLKGSILGRALRSVGGGKVKTGVRGIWCDDNARLSRPLRVQRPPAPLYRCVVSAQAFSLKVSERVSVRLAAQSPPRFTKNTKNTQQQQQQRRTLSSAEAQRLPVKKKHRIKNKHLRGGAHLSTCVCQGLH